MDNENEKPFRGTEDLTIRFRVLEWKRGSFYAEGVRKCVYCDLNYERRLCLLMRCNASARDDGKNVIFKFM